MVLVITSSIACAAGIACLLQHSKHKPVEKEDQTELLYLLIKTVWATASLEEANAMAIQNGKHNGELKRALAYMQDIKSEQRDNILKLGLRDVV